MPAPERGEPLQTGPEPTGAKSPEGGPTAAVPPRVVLEKQDIERSGPSSFRISGTVRNAGGTAAHGVQVMISAPDPVQGNPCFDDEIAIEPDPLPAGASTAFEKIVDHPCLHGDARVEISLRWQEP